MGAIFFPEGGSCCAGYRESIVSGLLVCEINNGVARCSYLM